MEKQRIKEIIIGITTLFIYFFVSIIEVFPFVLLHIDIDTFPTHLKVLYSLGCELLILAIILFLFKDLLKKDIKNMKQNYKYYFKDGLKYYFYGLGIMISSNFILLYLTGNIAGNEQTVRDILQQHPIYMFISAVLIAPLMEELLFRGAIRKIFKEKWIFILISGFFFGFLHVMGTMDETATNLENFYNFLYIIPYSSFGLVFAYMYEKYDNILVSTGFHFMHNFVALSLQILISIFL